MWLWLRRAVGMCSKVLAPSCSTCMRCWVPWCFTHEHTTHYGRCAPMAVHTVDGLHKFVNCGQSGCFALCEHCWGQLNTHQRLTYYYDLWVYWVRSSPSALWAADNLWQEWPLIRDAVLAGR